MLNEVSQIDKEEYHDIAYLKNLKLTDLEN